MKDYGQFEFKNLSWSPENTTNSEMYSYGERVFAATVWAIIAVVGTIGNSLVVLAVLLSRKLRTATNVFVVNLAVADFITSLFVTWSVLALLGRDGWPIPEAEWICAASGFMIFLCTGVSLYNLAAIALNRLVLITQPFEIYQKIYKPVHIGLMTALIWIIPFTILTALPLAGIGGFGYDKQHSTCSDLDHHPKGNTFELAQTVVFYPFPLITIVVSYALVFRHVKRHFKRQRVVELTDNSALNVSSSGSVATGTKHVLGDSQLDKTRKRVRASSRSERIDQLEVEITKNLFLVVCAFFLFFSPYFIALFIPGSDYFLFYGGISVLANSTINPVIYWRRHPHFKVVFSCMMRCRYADIPEPSDNLKRILVKNCINIKTV